MVHLHSSFYWTFQTASDICDLFLLIETLSSFGFQDTLLPWFSSYLTGHSFSVSFAGLPPLPTPKYWSISAFIYPWHSYFQIYSLLGDFIQSQMLMFQVYNIIDLSLELKFWVLSCLLNISPYLTSTLTWLKQKSILPKFSSSE